MRALIVDDEKLIVKGIKFSLLQDNYEVDTAYDGDEAIELFEKNEYDIVILDIMLPKKDGFTVCQIIREVSDVPVIMLTAKDSDMDKIMGLEYGADDYLTKPFNILELKARIKAVFRRTNNTRNNTQENNNPDIIENRGLKIKMSSKRAYVNDVEVNLTTKEYDMLLLMMTNPDTVYSREMLLKEVWKEKNNPEDVRTVDVHIRRLREKIEVVPSNPEYIYTKWGVGYYLKK